MSEFAPIPVPLAVYHWVQQRSHDIAEEEDHEHQSAATHDGPPSYPHQQSTTLFSDSDHSVYPGPLGTHRKIVPPIVERFPILKTPYFSIKRMIKLTSLTMWAVPFTLLSITAIWCGVAKNPNGLSTLVLALPSLLLCILFWFRFAKYREKSATLHAMATSYMMSFLGGLAIFIAQAILCLAIYIFVGLFSQGGGKQITPHSQPFPDEAHIDENHTILQLSIPLTFIVVTLWSIFLSLVESWGFYRLLRASFNPFSQFYELRTQLSPQQLSQRSYQTPNLTDDIHGVQQQTMDHFPENNYTLPYGSQNMATVFGRLQQLRNQSQNTNPFLNNVSRPYINQDAQMAANTTTTSAMTPVDDDTDLDTPTASDIEHSREYHDAQRAHFDPENVSVSASSQTNQNKKHKHYRHKNDHHYKSKSHNNAHNITTEQKMSTIHENDPNIETRTQNTHTIATIYDTPSQRPQQQRQRSYSPSSLIPDVSTSNFIALDRVDRNTSFKPECNDPRYKARFLALMTGVVTCVSFLTTIFAHIAVHFKSPTVQRNNNWILTLALLLMFTPRVAMMYTITLKEMLKQYFHKHAPSSSIRTPTVPEVPSYKQHYGGFARTFLNILAYPIVFNTIINFNFLCALLRLYSSSPYINLPLLIIPTLILSVGSIFYVLRLEDSRFPKSYLNTGSLIFSSPQLQQQYQYSYLGLINSGYNRTSQHYLNTALEHLDNDDNTTNNGHALNQVRQIHPVHDDIELGDLYIDVNHDPRVDNDLHHDVSLSNIFSSPRDTHATTTTSTTTNAIPQASPPNPNNQTIFNKSTKKTTPTFSYQDEEHKSQTR